MFPVSSRGHANGTSPQPNHGLPFGPDIPGTTTGGIQEAIHRALALGGGVVQLDPGAVYELRSPISLRSHVILEGGGATLRGPPGQEPVLQTLPDAVIRRCSVRGLVVDGGGVPDRWAVSLSSLQQSDIDLMVVNAGHGVRLHAPATAQGADPLLHANVCANRFRFVMDRVAGTGLLLQGTSPTAVVTDNTFPELYMTRVGRVGLDLAEWTDSNLFGHVFVSLSGNGGVGAVLNSVGAAQNHGVYNHLFAKLSVDAFGIQGATALRLFQSKQNVFSQLYTSPEGPQFPGKILDDRGSESAWVLSAGESRTYSWGVAAPTPACRSASVTRSAQPVTLISYQVPRDGTYELLLGFTLLQLRTGAPRLDAYWVDDSGTSQSASLGLSAPGRRSEAIALRAKGGSLISVASIGPFEAMYNAVATLKEVG